MELEEVLGIIWFLFLWKNSFYIILVRYLFIYPLLNT